MGAPLPSQVPPEIEPLPGMSEEDIEETLENEFPENK
jgi:hypothetical protein